MIDLTEVRSVTEFQRNIKDYVGRLNETKTPLVLTVNGRAELVVQNAESYQAILERLEHAETVAAVQRSMKDAEAGRMIFLTDEAYADLDNVVSFIRQRGSIDVARKWFAAILATTATLMGNAGPLPNCSGIR